MSFNCRGARLHMTNILTASLGLTRGLLETIEAVRLRRLNNNRHAIYCFPAVHPFTLTFTHGKVKLGEFDFLNQLTLVIIIV